MKKRWEVVIRDIDGKVIHEPTRFWTRAGAQRRAEQDNHDAYSSLLFEYAVQHGVTQPPWTATVERRE